MPPRTVAIAGMAATIWTEHGRHSNRPTNPPGLTNRALFLRSPIERSHESSQETTQTAIPLTHRWSVAPTSAPSSQNSNNHARPRSPNYTNNQNHRKCSLNSDSDWTPRTPVLFQVQWVRGKEW